MGTVERALKALIEDQSRRTAREVVQDVEEEMSALRGQVNSLRKMMRALTDHLEEIDAMDASLAVKIARAGSDGSEDDFSRHALKSLRRKFDLTQKELAELLKVSPSTIAAWESERTQPTPDNRAAIAALREASQEDIYRALGKEGKARPLSASEIRRIREEIGISQAKFAELLGVSTNTVGYWETGRTSPRSGSLEAIHELAEAESVPSGGDESWAEDYVEIPDEELTPDEIRNIRTEAGFSQADLADELGVSVNTVSNWENGHSYPRGRSLRKLLRIQQGS